MSEEQEERMVTLEELAELARLTAAATPAKTTLTMEFSLVGDDLTCMSDATDVDYRLVIIRNAILNFLNAAEAEAKSERAAAAAMTASALDETEVANG